MNLTEEQKKQFSSKFQEVLEYRLGLRLMVEIADKLGEPREEFANKADSMSQKDIDKITKDNWLCN